MSHLEVNTEDRRGQTYGGQARMGWRKGMEESEQGAGVGMLEMGRSRKGVVEELAGG